MLYELFEYIPFLRDLPDHAKEKISKLANYISLPSGSPLFLEGEASESMWFVATGCLGAFRKGVSNNLEIIGHIRNGEPVGEMSLISGGVHSASVYALRNTELIGFNRSAYVDIINSSPDFLQNLTKTILKRTRGISRYEANPKVFAFIAATSSIDIIYYANILKTEVMRIGKTCIIIGEENESKPSSWFDEIESSFDVIILASSLKNMSWTQTCTRQSDRTWFFGRRDAMPSSPLLPEEDVLTRDFKLIDVVLIKDIGREPVSEASHWLQASGAKRVLNWREGNLNDTKSLARILCNKSIGLVLSGGGARALSHIGAIRALRECSIEFDFLGGSSLGSVIAACVAMGWSDLEIEQRIFDAFVKTNPLNDYILPVVSFVSGKRVNERLKYHFGDIKIEDLKRNFFAVSSNLTTGNLKIHRQGILHYALRASISIPGILPPVINGDDILVDGAVLNNFPIEILKETHTGINYGVDVSQDSGIDAEEFVNPPNFFGWVLKNGFKNPPPIAELLMRAGTISLNPQLRRQKCDYVIIPNVSGIKIRQWQSFDEAIEAGYNAAVHQMKEMKLI